MIACIPGSRDAKRGHAPAVLRTLHRGFTGSAWLPDSLNTRGEARAQIGRARRVATSPLICHRQWTAAAQSLWSNCNAYPRCWRRPGVSPALSSASSVPRLHLRHQWKAVAVLKPQRPGRRGSHCERTQSLRGSDDLPSPLPPFCRSVNETL
jgi:hypothetical protein